jgi:cobalt/nickel transport system permease protein
MRHDFLDRYSRWSSPIHRLPAILKLSTALGMVVATVLMPSTRGFFFGGLALCLLVIAGLSRIPPRFLVRRLVMLEPLVLGVSVTALLQPQGISVFLGLVIKSTLCLWTMILLAATTPFNELIRILTRARVPSLLVTTLALMHRYLFVLVDEAERMQRARASRTFRRQRFQAWRSLAAMLGQLFVRTTERAERIYAAMCARGWK